MSGARILVIEDNVLNRCLVRDILLYRGHEVIEAGTADEARARLQARVLDIVLADIDFPGGGGELIVREIRANPSLVHLPVLAVTALSMEGDRERLLRGGFTAYVSKPIDTRTFGAFVESFVDKEGVTRGR